MGQVNWELLEQLCAIHAVSGREDNAITFIRDAITPLVDEISVDNIGNVVGILKGNVYPDHRLMLQAHMDELGFSAYITRDQFTTVS